MLALQLFQHICIGGVAGFGLLYRRQTQLVEEQLAQLLGGVDIEGAIGIGIDQLFRFVDPLGQHFAKSDQQFPVDGDAPVLHPVQDGAQRQFDLPVEGGHTVLFQLRFQNGPQIPQGLGAAGCILIFHGSSQEVGSQLGNGIVGLGGI